MSSESSRALGSGTWNHARFDEHTRTLIAESGQSTLRALLVMNGGAVAAFLTFLSPLINDGTDASKFFAALQLFVYGLLFSVIAFGTIHLSLVFSGLNKPRTSTTFYLATAGICLLAAVLFLRGVFAALDAASAT